MRAKFTLFPIIALLASAASGQTADRVFHFAHTEGKQNIGEVTTAIRTIADIKEAQADAAQKTLAVHGTTEQVALAEWLLHELDKPQAPAPNNQDEASHRYLMEGGGESTVRVFYMPDMATVQDFQEAATAIRTVADIRRVFTYNAPRALITRGTADQIGLAAWLVKQLEQPATSGNEYQLPLNADPHGEVVVRVFHVAHAESVQSFQEIATAIRTIADIRRVFTYNAARAVLIRSTAEQVALATWLLNQLDLPAIGQPGATAEQSSGTYEYDTPDNRDNMIRVFYLPPATSVQDLQQIATKIRTAANLRKVFTYSQPRALALRGTIDQISQAEQILKPAN